MASFSISCSSMRSRNGVFHVRLLMSFTHSRTVIYRVLLCSWPLCSGPGRAVTASVPVHTWGPCVSLVLQNKLPRRQDVPAVNGRHLEGPPRATGTCVPRDRPLVSVPTPSPSPSRRPCLVSVPIADVTCAGAPYLPGGGTGEPGWAIPRAGSSNAGDTSLGRRPAGKAQVCVKRWLLLLPRGITCPQVPRARVPRVKGPGDAARWR